MERRAYFVCMVQRSGSNVLCEALTRTGVAGRPTEYFMPAFPGASEMHRHAGFEASPWAREHDVATFADFLAAVLREGTTPNGVFGAKVPWNAFGALLEKLRALPGGGGGSDVELLARSFGAPRFLHLRRRDRVRQAVSWALAAKTGRFASSDGPTADVEPEFDLELVDGLYRLVVEGDVGWRAFFRRAGALPLEIAYEELDSDLERELRRVLAWLGVVAPASIEVGALAHRRQAGDVNERWVERFRAARPDARA